MSIAHHWKGVWGLGTWVDTDGHIGATLVPDLVRDAQGASPGLNDAAHILVFFGRETEDEVELHLSTAHEDPPCSPSCSSVTFLLATSAALRAGLGAKVSPPPAEYSCHRELLRRDHRRAGADRG